MSGTPATVRPMHLSDLDAAAAVHAAAFVRQQDSRLWLQCCLNASPRSLCYIAEQDGKCIGYLIWMQKSGFRPEVVLELEQIAIDPKRQNCGHARQLIRDSLQDVRQQLQARHSRLKHVIVTTRADNHAQQLYASELGASIEARLENLYSADEVIMVARDL